jgi:large subunit ribosomal protein L25
MKTDMIELQALKRDEIGRSYMRRIRRQHKVPAVMYGNKQPQVLLTLNHFDLDKVLKTSAFQSSIFQINCAGKEYPVVLKDIQMHPCKPIILHLDFQVISKEQQLTMKVNLNFINAEKSPGIEVGGEILHYISEVSVKCLPKDLPTAIVVDLGNLALDHSFHLSGVEMPKGVVLDQDISGDHDHAVVSCRIPKEQQVGEGAPEIIEEEESDDAETKDSKE